MVSDQIYELCAPVLEEEDLGEEEKIEKLEELLGAEPASLKGKALEDAVLGAVWQWKSSMDKTSSPAPARGFNVNRSISPAPWLQRTGTPGSNNNSPRLSHASLAAPPGLNPLNRTKSSTASPFVSPKPSPRMAVATPASQNSSHVSGYFSAGSPLTADTFGDYGSDGMDWLVNDDASSTTSLGDSLNNNTNENMPSYAADMTPYDMLRSILQNDQTDEELEQILEANGYDFGQTIASIMESQGVIAASTPAATQTEAHRTYLIGKSMSPSSRPVTPAGQTKSPIVCRYWLASGHCARADCRFAHEVTNHVCKYWLQGNCIAGNGCLFSHDPAALMQQLTIAGSGTSTPQAYAPNFQLQDYESFPTLQRTTSNPYEDQAPVDPSSLKNALQKQMFTPMLPAFVPSFVPTGPRHGSKPNSRPASRHASRAPTPSQPNFHDDEAFPSLGSAAATKPAKRHHGKRGGHGHRDNNIAATPPQPANLADVVRMSPSPGPNNKEAMRRGLRNNRSFTSTRENSLAATNIPAPVDIPWLVTGSGANQAYLNARQEAFKHGNLRNKFLQSAAQAWNRNDARGAKALSLRGQNENTLMREKHREAAQALYTERNAHINTTNSTSSKELYVDLHGLHPEEAVSYLNDCLKDLATSTRPVYAICGTGHHSKNGKDKVGKAVRLFLTEWRYAFREFSVPGDRNNVGGILGIDPRSFDKSVRPPTSSSAKVNGEVCGVVESKGEDTKVLVVKEDPRKAVAVVGKS